MDVAKTIREIDGNYIINWCKEHKDIAWLKKTSKNNKNFIALRTAFVNHYDEFKELRPKAKKLLLWERIEKLED